MLELKVRKFGNSLGVILPKEAINRLHADDGQRLFLIEAPGGTYQLTPSDPDFQKKMVKAERIMARYRNALQPSRSEGADLERLLRSLNSRSLLYVLQNRKDRGHLLRIEHPVHALRTEVDERRTIQQGRLHEPPLAEMIDH